MKLTKSDLFPGKSKLHEEDEVKPASFREMVSPFISMIHLILLFRWDTQLEPIGY